MRVEACHIEGLCIIEPKVFGDARGYFFESYNQAMFKQHGLNYTWVQDNQSSSVKGVIRGLHFQAPPFAQTKLVRVLRGSILDVAVDIRKGSPTYGQHVAVELSAENKLQLLIPAGFAHGFSVLSDHAEVMYKCDQVYNRESEGGLFYNDSTLNIDWRVPVDAAIVSDKDQILPRLSDFNSPF